MRKPEDWPGLLQPETAFQALQESIIDGRWNDYRQVPPEAFAWHAWDLTSEDQIFKMILPFLRQQLARAQKSMPGIYPDSLAKLDASAICTEEDWHHVPLLMKDDDPEHGIRGFRKAVNNQPGLLKPQDVPAAAAVFGSGGSRGKYTPTYVTLEDRQREIQGWRRGHDYHGLTPGDVALYTYNTTHKGGQWMQESLWAHGVDVLLRRPEEGPEKILQNIQDYGANVLLTVQQPYETMKNQAKSAGANLHSLIMASLENPQYRGILLPDERGRKQIEFIFLGGFEIVPYALEIVNDYLEGTPIATLLGSSEAIPQACSTNPNLTPGGCCHHNHLHLMQGPHYIEVVKPSQDSWVPVKKGEQGLLAFTSWARDGTIWIRYAPGDVATLYLEEGECPCGLLSPVIDKVHRLNPVEQEELLTTGCAAG
ncbi:MAG: hypothetical protein ACM3PY_10370 [Omnitrophica WOR_2 bacterium]